MSFDSQDPIFEQLIPAILNWEGGAKLVDHPRDPGGKTKYGISQLYNADTLKAMNIASVKSLTEDQARQIYYEKYYLPSGAQELEDSGLALIHLDAAINHGVGAAKAMMSQLSLNPHNYAGRGLNKAVFNEMSLEYIGLRQARYVKDPNANVFLEGWDNRLIRIINAHVRLYMNPDKPLTGA